ncbi:TPA: hypothetical protein HA251_08850 [Candidatus Woesearchaeota archaeon]|nr:hypothetical protein [Candidatus Woesearchaeota archaeon]
MRNRKGTEKPIEIFVALFIILAVALVMLKLFQSQIADKQKELADVTQEQKTKEMLSKVRQACSDKCVEASNNQCSPAALASLCMYNSRKVPGAAEFIDLDNDQKSGMDTTLLAGVGVCEDQIYCFHLVENCCGREISAQSCKAILSDYWSSKPGLGTISSLLGSNVPPGKCASPTIPATHWYRVEGWSAS